ncbi:unnamed protein product [Brassica oleracea]
MITDIGKHCLDLQDIDQLNKQPVVIITNDDYGVGGFANVLKNQFGVRVIRTLPKGMKTIPICKYLSPEEYSQLLTRAARLRQAAEDRRYEQAAGQASFLSPPQEEEILDWKRQERSSSSTLSLKIRQQEGRL